MNEQDRSSPILAMTETGNAPNGFITRSRSVLLVVASVLCCDEQRPLPPHSAASVETGPSSARMGCTAVPAPRWVLRDKDGHQVRALVEPRCGMDYAKSLKRCLPLDFGSSSGFPCVRVIDHEDRYINVEYDLLSGEIGPCQGKFDDIDAPWEVVENRFADENCQGQRYRPTTGGSGYHNPQFTGARAIASAEGDMWYPTDEGCLPKETPTWVQIDTCEMTQPQALCPYQVVPPWVIGLLPNPPYSLAVEYE